jgi:hypothetical protein
LIRNSQFGAGTTIDPLSVILGAGMMAGVPTIMRKVGTARKLTTKPAAKITRIFLRDIEVLECCAQHDGKEHTRQGANVVVSVDIVGLFLLAIFS